MEHPPKQGLKLDAAVTILQNYVPVLMEHPPKQGLKLQIATILGTNTEVLMEHPPKQGLKHVAFLLGLFNITRF